MKRATFLLALVAVLLVGGSAAAMSSTNYRLDWFSPLTAGGGGTASSTNYAIDFIIGQVAIGTSSSASYEGCLGYWCGAAAGHRIYLPLVLRTF
jgi:hypothetical protein